MVQVAYSLLDLEPHWQKVFFTISTICLVLLIPGTALGYFAERSIPGQPLYSMKKGIEAVVLAVESLTPYGKTNYLLNLADTRVNEASTLIDNASTSGDYKANLQLSDQTLSYFVTSVRSAQSEINNISNTTQKQAAQKKLESSIEKYQDHLTTMKATIQQPSTNFVGLENSSVPTESSRTSSTTALDSSTQVDVITQQITDTQTDLHTIQDQLLQDVPPPVDESNTSASVPSPTVTDSPTPTIPPFFFNDSHDGHGNHTDGSQADNEGRH